MATQSTVRSRSLRNAMPEPEVWLWGRLKRLHARGFHFRRQRAFHGYYLDFVCIDRRLVVELDGGQHNHPIQIEHDRVRDAVLTRAGYKVLRFWNFSVRTDIDHVVNAIILALEAQPSTRRRASQGRVDEPKPRTDGADGLEAPSVSVSPPPWPLRGLSLP